MDYPTDLLDVLGKRAGTARWKSLGTSDGAEARKQAHSLFIAWNAEFDELRRRRNPDASDLKAIVWETYQHGLAADQAHRDVTPDAEEIDTVYRELEGEYGPDSLHAWSVAEELSNHVQDDREGRAQRSRELRTALASNDRTPVREALKSELTTRGVTLDPTSIEFKRLALEIMRAEIEVLKRAEERDAGKFDGAPSDPGVTPPSPSAARPVAKPGETMLELFDAFRRHQAGKKSEDMWKTSRRVMEVFASFVGESTAVTAITKADAREWRDALSKLPTSAQQVKEFAGLTTRQTIAKNETVQRPVITRKSVRKYQSIVGNFFGHLVSEGYVEHNPIAGTVNAKEGPTTRVYPYTGEQLQTIFASPLFTGCEADNREYLPGTHRIRDWRYWIPLILLYTGARLSEIAQLHTADVREMHGTWVFSINDEGEPGETKSVKNASSMRIVPVHAELVKLGFLDFHRGRVESGDKRLFPDLKPDARGQWAGKPSKMLNTYLQRIGVKQDKSRNVHSLRHGMADAFRRAGLLDREFGFLLGHSDPTMTGHYGVLPQGTLKKRVKLINSATFPGLDLSHLYPSN